MSELLHRSANAALAGPEKKLKYFHISLMLSNRNAFTTKEEAVPGRGKQLKVGEQDGMVWDAILADMSSLRNTGR